MTSSPRHYSTISKTWPHLQGMTPSFPWYDSIISMAWHYHLHGMTTSPWHDHISMTWLHLHGMTTSPRYDLISASYLTVFSQPFIFMKSREMQPTLPGESCNLWLQCFAKNPTCLAMIQAEEALLLWNNTSTFFQVVQAHSNSAAHLSCIFCFLW